MRNWLRWPTRVEIPPNEQFLQWLAHIVYIFAGIFFLSLYRMPTHYLICLAICGVVELGASYIRSEGRSLKIPITGFISAGTFFMFTESLHAQVYIIGSLVAVFSKYFIRYNGKHVFNPGNIAVLAVVTLLPQYAVSVPGQWGGDWWFILLVGVIGAAVSIRAKRIWVAIAYAVSFVIFSSLRGFIFDVSPIFLAGSVIGVPSMIYLFHMITDPATSPRRQKYQILFGASLGLLDVFLRFKEIIYAPIIALAAITALMPLIHILNAKARQISLPNGLERITGS